MNTSFQLGSQDVLLFDGDCGICTKSAELARRIARNGTYAVHPYQMFTEEELQAFGINYELCARRIHTITQRGRVYGGAFSLNHFCWRHFPWSMLPVIIYLLPPLLAAEIGLYAVVAHNRQRISRWLGLTACAVPRASR
ncbi:MAG TPA: DCC1-like thiol-disulfide oxidoreductase family protein [Candidatus Kapabacteria bacterium]|nr:DCC1-like thiol-disulfide oxidoreductase family protein [Candidatus Kapabacteria bacterium]